MKITELIQYSQDTLNNISKVFIGLFTEVSKSEKFMRKHFKKNVLRMYEKKFWFINNLIDLDINQKVKELKENKNIKSSDVKKLEEDLNNTKKGLALFFDRLKNSKKDDKSDKLISDIVIASSDFKTERNSVLNEKSEEKREQM